MTVSEIKIPECCIVRPHNNKNKNDSFFPCDLYTALYLQTMYVYCWPNSLYDVHHKVLVTVVLDIISSAD